MPPESQRRRDELGIAVLVLLAGLLALLMASRYVTLRDAERIHTLALSQHAAAMTRNSSAPFGARSGVGVREPEGHLPLRGMPDFTGDTEDACLRMEGFLISAMRQLEEAGHPAPYSPEELTTRLQDTRCALDDPALAPLLRELDQAWRAAEQAPVGPLGSL